MNDWSPDLWREAGRLFNELVELETAERISRLTEIGRSDPLLRDAVNSLLSADAVADDRLARFELGIPRLVSPDTTGEVPGDPLGLIGRTISHFQVLEYIASGGMGIVYRAHDTLLNRSVAIKFPVPYAHPDAAIKERFKREAQSVGALDHVNLCTAYEVGESEAGLFLAMPFYQGETLKSRIARNPRFEITEALGIARQLASGLASAHAAGVVHRDLKPGNVMILPDGTVKILDFGLAKVGDLSQTKSGVALGTISYMAPEQIRDARVNARADLWSVGVILYEMLTGARPFSGEHEVSITHAILNKDPEDPSGLRDGLPRAVQDLVLALLQKNPAHRYPGADQLARDIEALERGATPAFRPPRTPRLITWMRRRPIRVAVVLAMTLTTAIALAAPRLSNRDTPPTENTESYRFYLGGRDYERQGSYAPAESLYHRAIALDSGFALARARLAVVYAACRVGGSRDCFRRRLEDRPVNRVEQIRTEAAAALRLEPRLPDGHFAMGLYWEQKEDPGRALSELELARRGMAKSGELHAAVGRAYRALGRWDEAISELERALELDPRDASSAGDLATTYSRLRRYDESVRSWNHYLALVPDAYQGMIIRGNVFLRWHGTIDTLVAVVDRLPPEWRRRATSTRVLLARIQKRPDVALAALDEADRNEANHSRALMRAQIYTELGDSARARSQYEAALRILEDSVTARPDEYRVHISLGLAYAGLGRAEEAKRAADRAMTIMPPSRTVPAGTTAMKGAAEIFAMLPQYHTRSFELIDQLMQLPAGREVSVPFLRVDPAWKPIRGDPRFERMLQKYSGT